MTTPFVRFLEERLKVDQAGPPRRIPLKVRVAEENRISLWQKTVQTRYIDKDPSRPDAGWNWLRIGGRWLSRRDAIFKSTPTILELVVSNLDGYAVQVGMMAIAPKYRWPGGGQSTFLWYLSKAPNEILESAGVPRSANIFEAMMDAALCTAMDNPLIRNPSHRGRLWLHAAPHSETRIATALYNKYLDYGLQAIPRNERVFVSRSRLNDGRYFRTSGEESLALLGKLNYLR